MRLKGHVAVAAKHKEKGRPGDFWACPVALALDETFEGYAFYVGSRLVTVYDKNQAHILGECRLPDEVIEWIHDFDIGGYANNPFEFDFEAEVER